MSAQPHGVHLVGSINLPTTADVFDQIPNLLPNRLRRLPDGETGKRHYFTRWQRDIFAAVPEVWARGPNGEVRPGPSGLTPDERDAALKKLEDLETHYDDYALESYALFKQQKEIGHIPPHVRFQVSLPGLVNLGGVFTSDFVDHLEPRYEDALVRALTRIQSMIPHSELAIQIDAALEIAFLERVKPWEPYFDPILPGVVDRMSRFANRVAPEVELGFHLCYGDIGHRHFVEPKDTGVMVELANALVKSVKRDITWFHMPVPKDRKDLEYFKALEGLELKSGSGAIELYLGLVHVGDEEGTWERIAAAQKVVQEFGVATECGMGRTPVEDFASIMEILREVSAPVV